MTEESTPASSHLPVVMATTGMTQVTSSSSRGVEFYFQIAALLIGVLGTAANALVLYALAEMTMGQRVTGHGSSGSTNLSGSRGSRVSTRDPLTHDQVNKIPRTG